MDAADRSPLQRVVIYGTTGKSAVLTAELIEQDVPPNVADRADLVLILHAMIAAAQQYGLLSSEHLVTAAELHRRDLMERLGGPEALASKDPRQIAALLDTPARPRSFKHFASGAAVAGITFDKTGNLMKPEENRKASGTESKKILGSLGIGAHVYRGHFFDDKTLLSQMKSGISNFTWHNDQAALETIENGRRAFEDDDDGKECVVDMPAGAGHGYVKGGDGSVYRVVPRAARVIRKAKGDFKTAYGITDVWNVGKFGAAYYTAEKLEESKR